MASGGREIGAGSLRFLATKRKFRANRGAAAAFRLGASASSAAVEIRHERRSGRDFLIVPVVALTQTVLECVTCTEPELAPADEFAREPEAWNGLPLCYEHPQDAEGNYVSARAAAAKDFIIGHVENSRRDGDRLLMDAAVDIERAKQLGADEVLERLEKGEPVEVSTGFWCETVKASGSQGDRAYTAVQYGHQGDHLALLGPDATGACSWEQGCGAPRAAKGKAMPTKLRSNCGDAKHSCAKCAGKKLAALVKQLVSGDAEGFRALAQLQLGAVSDVDLAAALYVQISAKNPGASWCYVIAVFSEPSEVVFVVGSEEGGEYKSRTLAQAYAVTSADDGAVELQGEAREVRPVTRYVNAEQSDDGDGPSVDQNKEVDMTKKEREALVAKLVANRKLSGEAASKFVASMEKVDDDTLKALHDGDEASAEAVTKAEEEKAAAEKKAEEAAKASAPAPKEEKPAEGDAVAKAAALKTLGLTPESLGFLVGFAEKSKAEAIALIKANKGSKFTDAQLAAMDVETLTTLAATLKANEAPAKPEKKDTSFTLLGGPREGDDDGEVDPLSKSEPSALETKIRALRGGKAA